MIRIDNFLSKFCPKFFILGSTEVKLQNIISMLLSCHIMKYQNVKRPHLFMSDKKVCIQQYF